MQNAIEFITRKKEGGIIQIPKEFEHEVSGEFRVILILKSSKIKKKASRKRELKAFKVNAKGFKFNRDEIYDE